MTTETTDTTHEASAGPQLNEFVDPDQIKKDMHIDLSDLTTAMQQHSGLYAHYGIQAVRAKRQYERQKTALEILEAQLDGKYRSQLKEENPKTTEPQIRSAIVNDRLYRAMSSRVIHAQEIYRMAEVAERAFHDRREMLLQIARDAARQEAGPMRVVANQSNRDRLLDAMQRNQTATQP